MSTGLASFKSTDAIFDKAARAIFESIKPTILLIGEWDEHFANIAELFQWSEHRPSVPRTLNADVALVVTNSGRQLKQVLSRAHPYTAVIAYDVAAVIPLESRTGSGVLMVSYLNSVSDRFMRGQVRSILQLQKHFITLVGDVPVIVTQEGARLTIDRLFQGLDMTKSVDVRCDYIDTFFGCFAAFAELTAYQSPVLVHSPKDFAASVKRGVTTLVLRCAKKLDKKAYQKLALGRRAVVYVHTYDSPVKGSLDLSGIGHAKEDYYLAAFFLSLEKNLCDPENQTKFIQIGDTDRVIAEVSDTAAFARRVRALLAGSELRLRNIAPKINNVDFSVQPMAELMSRFEKAAYEHLFTQCDYAADTAQLVSGIPQTTLYEKSKKMAED